MTRKEFEKQTYLKASRYYVEDFLPESVKDILNDASSRRGSYTEGTDGCLEWSKNIDGAVDDPARRGGER